MSRALLVALAASGLLVQGCNGSDGKPQALGADDTCGAYNEADQNARIRAVRKLATDSGHDTSSGAVSNYLGTASYQCGTDPDFKLGDFYFAKGTSSPTPSAPKGAPSDCATNDEIRDVVKADLSEVLAYDYRRLEADIREAQSLSTGKFLEDYNKAVPTLRTTVSEQQPRSIFVTDTVAFESGECSNPKYLVAGTQTTISKSRPAPGFISKFTVHVTLKWLGNQYKVSELVTQA